MRELTEEESKTFFEKLAKFIGTNTKLLLERTDEEHCFRLQKDRVYYVSKRVVRHAVNFARVNLASLGTCFGKFTKGGKFKLHVTCLDFLAQYARYKVWVKPSAEMSFLYGNHVLKGGLGRITEATPAHQGVVVFSMSDVALGFGTTAYSTQECRKLGPDAIVVYHQGDVGEYLRAEDTMMVS